jgi:signal transduction histidine kinase
MATSSPIASRSRLRSLYWRAVFGFSACIAGVLAVQVVAVVLWLKSVPDSQRLRAFTQTVATDVAHAMETSPGLDVQRYIDTHYPSPFASLYIVTASDQRIILRGNLKPPEDWIAGAIDFYRRNPHPTSIPDSWLSPPLSTSPLVVNGQVAGGVAVVVPQSWRQLIGWKMALLSASLLIVATLLATHFVFGTVRRRVRNLQDAAVRCGAGDFSARAEATGSDELADLAAAFNRMAQDLGLRDEQLKASDRARRQLLADVSHELMTPLTSIRAYGDVLSISEAGRDPDAARCLVVIGDETERLERLVGDLLDLARLEAAGDDRLSREDVAVENLFGRVASRLEPQAHAAGVTLATFVGAGAELVYGDPLRLEQAVQNLAANALRHTPGGGSVTLSAELRGATLLLSVQDTGEGIPAAHLPFVFDRFYKVESARSGDGAIGSGLGLSIVKAIVERHGGSVTVASQPNVATVFTISLPLAQVSTPRPGVAA